MIIEDYDFYFKLKPSLKYELTQILFGTFKKWFERLFTAPDMNYHSDKMFQADFLANLYCRIFTKDEEAIFMKNEDLEEMCLINEGSVNVFYVKKEKDNSKLFKVLLLELPENSYFGDF